MRVCSSSCNSCFKTDFSASPNSPKIKLPINKLECQLECSYLVDPTGQRLGVVNSKQFLTLILYMDKPEVEKWVTACWSGVQWLLE